MRLKQKFLQNKTQHTKFYRQLKQTPCPHCNRRGQLIRHGFLTGYDIHSLNKTMIRGYRFYCSNRNRRAGCGRTFSLLLSRLIKQFTITTAMLWQICSFLLKDETVSGMNAKLPARLSVTSVYRLIKTLSLSQSKIRTRLYRHGKTARQQEQSPLHQTLNHLKQNFGRVNPIRKYQEAFQTPFI
jgi:hypothetical protein